MQDGIVIPMPRSPRIDFPDAVYYVTSRGNGRADIFWTDDDRQRFLSQLAHHLQMTGVVLYAYVLMDNHFHGLVRTPRANLSVFIQHLLTAYALYARYKHRRPGHLFQGRFKAKLVEDALEEIDAAVARRYGVDPAVLKTHGHHAGPAKAAAVAVASRLANLSGRQIGQHYGIGSAAIGAIHRRLADRPDALKIVESLSKQLRNRRIKYKA